MPENKLNDEKVLAMFVDRLIADKGGDTLDAKQKETLQKELLEELDERIQQAMIRALPDAKLMELEKLLDEDAPDEEIEGFFKGADADFDPAIRKAMDEFRTDYFKDKIKVSVKTSILEAAPAAAAEAPKAEVSSAVPVAPVPAATAVPAGSAAQVTDPAAPAAGQPVQGTVSAVPGQSNVEGVANAVSAIEQGQVPVAQPQVVAQGASTVPAAPVTSAAQTAPTTPATPAVQAIPAAPVTQATPVAASAEQPLQAAPNLMDALNTAAESLNAATKNLNTATENLNTAAGTDAPTANTNVDINTGANAATNTDMTGKEA